MSVAPDAERLRYEMTRRGWSASDLAHAARVSPATVSAALAGRRLASRSLACIAHALGNAPVIDLVEALVKADGKSMRDIP